tara:strand:+ start:1863 stop:4457 length:2595 start_codon:yes stop_codon:yes gene_type:complete
MGGIVKGIVNIVTGIVKAVVGVIKSVVDFVGDVIGFVINPMGAFDAPQTADPGAEAQGVVITKSGTNVPIPVIYGFRRTGGINLFAETNGTTNRYLYVVYALCEGPIHGVGRILINDVELPMPAGGIYALNAFHNVDSGRYSGRVKMEFFYGENNQPQSTLANESATWPKKPRFLPGLAYAVMRFEWKEVTTQEDADNNPFSGGIPNVKFDVFGKKVYDVRTHSANSVAQISGTYATRQSSAKYSFNPASCLLDYLENTRYGCGISVNKIHGGSLRLSANKFEQDVAYSNTQRGRALTMNAQLNTGAQVIDNVKILLAGARGSMPYSQGRYKLKVEDGGNATDITSAVVTVAYDVDYSNIIGGISLTGERKRSKFNQVIINYINPDLEFSNQQEVFRVDGDKTIDSEEELSGEFTFHTITNPAIAQDLAQMIYKKSRTQRSIEFTATQELLDVEIGDIIRVTDVILDLDQQTFRVVGMKLLTDGNIAMECIEHDATIYPFVTGEQVEIPPALYRPDEFTVIPYTRELPDQALSLFPPLDPDFDSAGAPFELPPSFDTPLKKVTSFEDFNKGYIQPYVPGLQEATYGQLTKYNFYAGRTGNDGYRDPLTGAKLNVKTLKGAIQTPRDQSSGGAFLFEDSGLAYYPPYITPSIVPKGGTQLDSGGEGPVDFPYEIVGARPTADADKITQFRSYDHGRIPFDIFGHSRRGGDNYLMRLNMPKDSVITHLLVEHIDKTSGEIINLAKLNLRDPNTGGLNNPYLNARTRQDYATGLYHPIDYAFYPRSKNAFVSVKWLKETEVVRMEFADGSNLYEFKEAYPDGYTYDIGGGRYRSDNNIEAYFNYLNTLYFSSSTSSANVSFSQNLGG